MNIVNFGANGVITERIKTFIARILNPSITTNKEIIGTDANSLNGRKVRISNMYEEEYELWLDKDLYFTDFVEPQERSNNEKAN